MFLLSHPDKGLGVVRSYAIKEGFCKDISIFRTDVGVSEASFCDQSNPEPMRSNSVRVCGVI